MAEGAVTFLLEKVKQILIYYLHLFSEAENELKQLERELGSLKAFLADAAKKQRKDASFGNMEKQIREVVYEAEDTIDSCLTQAVAPNAKGFKKFLGLRKSVNLKEEVKSMREKMKPMIEMISRAIAQGPGKEDEQPPIKERKSRAIREDNVVGFEDQEEIIINYLKEQRGELDVISIIGMPGLGKTTLAWKIYQNPIIQYEFATRIWVNVSQEFSIREVLLNILKAFTSRDMSSLNEHDLFQEVRGNLKTGKFLLVMDDVWSVQTWNAIKDVLPKKNAGGKVLITSRYRPVGVHANPSRPEPHMLRFLTEKESWTLLQFEVYGDTNKYPQELETMGKQIAKECGGLPLAILVIGGILLDHKTGEMDKVLSAWGDVSENVSAYIRKNIENDEQYNISDVVAQSYNRLQDNLRECFLYIGVFPEDYAIPVRTLTSLWIAEGFIQDKGEGLENTAEENLADLIDKNLVMVDKTTPYGELKTCRVHDVIREFCISKAGINEQSLYQEIKKTKQGVFHPLVSEIEKHRRICIHLCVSDLFYELAHGKIKGRYIRSFLSFCKDSFTLDPKYISAIPDYLYLLRVLDSKSFKFPKFPEKVTNLTHLRYITLSCDDLSSLPESISKLWSLQTFLVSTKSPTLRIKANIWKLNQLRHLKTKAEIVLDMQGQSKAGQNNNKNGENLQTLTRLSPKCCTEDVFNRARNLNKLGIRGELAILLEKNRSFAKLERLENLKLVNDLRDARPLQNLPRENFFPQSINRLTLSATHLDWKHMTTLGMISSLKVLKLKDNAFTGMSWNVDGGFRHLQFLLISTTDLVNWIASGDNHFPRLSCLVLEYCKELDKIPTGLAQTLRKLEMKSVGETAIDSAKEIGKKASQAGFKLTIDHQLIKLQIN